MSFRPVQLQFDIVAGSDARTGNLHWAVKQRLIMSVDTSGRRPCIWSVSKRTMLSPTNSWSSTRPTSFPATGKRLPRSQDRPLPFGGGHRGGSHRQPDVAIAMARTSSASVDGDASHGERLSVLRPWRLLEPEVLATVEALTNIPLNRGSSSLSGAPRKKWSN